MFFIFFFNDTATTEIYTLSLHDALPISIGMPLFYKHWSFGKHFAQHEALYRKGMRGLAYEIVINSSPCISYVMEENTTTMQALVIAHAAFGQDRKSVV